MENNYDENEYYDEEEYEKAMYKYNAQLDLMKKYLFMPFVCLDFSNCLSEEQLSKQPKGKVFETIYKMLIEMEEIRDEAYNNNPDVIPKFKLLMSGTPAGDKFHAVLEKLSVLIQYFNIKYIPGYTVLFRSDSSCDSMIHERILKNGKLIAALNIRSNIDAVAEYKKKYYDK